MREHPPVVTCYLAPTQNLYHLSKLLTGLCRLAAHGQIELRFTTVAENSPYSSAEAMLNVFVTHDGMTRHVVFDLYDKSDRFDSALLDACGVYFKRSFHAPHIRMLPTSWQHKVLPLGLNYGCRGPIGESRLLESSVDRASVTTYHSLLPFEEFEQHPHAAVTPSIVFQTRAWAPDSTSDNAEEVNETRAEIIRALRKAFPNRFHGGFVRNAHALRRYPDLLTEHGDQQSEYIRCGKRYLVGISTRGLHGSVPFKLPEMMASSRAVVSHALSAELPSPYLPGTDFLDFLTPQECVAQCDRILGDPSLASSLRQASWRYYEAHVRPGRHVGDLIGRALLSHTHIAETEVEE